MTISSLVGGAMSLPGFRLPSLKPSAPERHGFFSRKKVANAAGSEKPKAAQGGEAACCSITSLDELANAANQGSSFGDKNMDATTEMISITNGHETIHNPFAHSKLETALTPFVSVLGVAGIYIGYTIYKDFNAKKLSLQDAFVKINTIMKDGEFEGKKLNLTPQQRQTYQAYATVIKEQYNEADFQQFWAGKLSALTSAGIVAGQVIMPLGIASLCSLSVMGGAHTVHMARNIAQNTAKIRRTKVVLKEPRIAPTDTSQQRLKAMEMKIKDAQIRQDYFKGKRRHEWRNLFSWGAFTLGAGTLGVAQAVAYAHGVGVATQPAIAGVSALGVGVAGTLVENNILTSSRYITAMPLHAWKSMSDLAMKAKQADWYGANNHQVLSEQDVHQKNCIASRRLQISTSYRAQYFRSRTTGQRFTHAMLRTRQKVLAYGTLGLVKHFTAQMKFNDKVRISRQNAGKIEEVRLSTLENLRNVEQNPLHSLPSVQKRPVGHAEKSPLKKLVDTIISTGHEDGVAKMIALKIMKSSTEIKPQYKDLFDIRTPDFEFENYNGESPDDRMQAFKTIKDTPPCCASTYESQGIMEYIQKIFANSENTVNADKKERMQALVQEATDHYLLYQSRKTATEHIAIWSNLSDAYQRAGV